MQELAGETITRGKQEWRSPGLQKELRTKEFLHSGFPSNNKFYYVTNNV